jgi:hypothetical protein
MVIQLFVYLVLTSKPYLATLEEYIKGIIPLNMCEYSVYTVENFQQKNRLSQT